MLASQVYQVFYVVNPIEKDVSYARNKVPIDLYDLEGENCPNIRETFWRKPNNDIGTSTRLDEGNFRWSREDGAIVVVDIPSTEEHSEDIVVETSEEKNEFDGPSINKKKGATQMAAVHGRTERQLIVLNELNHPIGLTKAVITEFSSFLGTLARNGTFCPLNLSWAKLKTIMICRAISRGHKSRFKKDRYYAYPNDEIRLANSPKTISEPIFADLLQYWNAKEAKVEMERVENQESEYGSQSVDAFTTVMGPDHPGRVRLFRCGVTKSLLKQKENESGPSSNIIADELVKKRMDELEERIQQRM
ncbi:uncharacterized protein LOC124897929 [Capsicum annuum]|uniref:uncharacterized protein LOC124897929 n=1 Tax=Capsicum annuum TaxID=4072 RepID=UPI001FB16DB0|nr:uncharacterized protein LOC124897929 [Capsicum annuum]